MIPNRDQIAYELSEKILAEFSARGWRLGMWVDDFEEIREKEMMDCLFRLVWTELGKD